MILRRALACDASALARVDDTRPQAAGWGKSGFEGELAQPCAQIWCACEGEEIIGFAALRAAAGHAEVLNVAVLPDCGRKGVGFALLSRALEELKQAGSWRVSLEVAQDNAPALALYRKAGFVPLGRRKDFYGVGRDALVLGVNI